MSVSKKRKYTTYRRNEHTLSWRRRHGSDLKHYYRSKETKRHEGE